ncbi:hypothetical protein Fmac_015355 [Flemingia macrophylla]|uniref:chalcone synthase n=1 Tax=Flemingia macrophylla TaxID=520843 RepID=A0ABD1MEX5_9FABA
MALLRPTSTPSSDRRCSTTALRLVFELVSTAQTILPDSDGVIDGHLRKVGMTFHLLKDVPGIISKNIKKSLTEAFASIGIDDWNSLYWIAHPGCGFDLHPAASSFRRSSTSMKINFSM